MKKLILIILSILLLNFLHLYALDADNDLYFGARTFGLSKAFTAVDGDINSITWNPAGTGSLKSLQITTSYYNPGQLSWRKRLFFGLGLPTKIGVHSLSIAMGEINYNGIYDFESSNRTFTYTYSMLLGKKNYFGINFGYNDQESYDSLGNKEKGKGFNIDAGFIIKVKPQFSIGLSAKNIYGETDWDNSNSVSKDMKYSAGIRYLIHPKIGLTVDLYGDEEESVRSLNVGGEYIVWSTVLGKEVSKSKDYFKYLQKPHYLKDVDFIVRAGLEKELYGEDYLNFSAGMSITVGQTHLDYAMLIKEDDASLSGSNEHYVSLGIDFGKPKKIIKQPNVYGTAPPKIVSRPSPLPVDSIQNNKLVQNTKNAVKIAITNFTTTKVDNSYDWISTGISDILKTIVGKDKNVSFTEDTELKEMLNLLSVETSRINSEVATQLGILVNADLLITGSFIVEGKNIISIRIKMFDVDTKSRLLDKQIRGKISSIFYLVDALGKEVNKSLDNYDTISYYQNKHRQLKLSSK